MMHAAFLKTKTEHFTGKESALIRTTRNVKYGFEPRKAGADCLSHTDCRNGKQYKQCREIGYSPLICFIFAM